VGEGEELADEPIMAAMASWATGRRARFDD